MSTSPNPSPSPKVNAAKKFQTTKWSIVKRAASSDTEVAKAAFSDLYDQYRPPILQFLEFFPGVTKDEAEDIFQDYFVDLMRRGFFDKASASKGRLRSFLLRDLNFFLKNRRRKADTKKRGGQESHLSFNDLDIEVAGSQMDPAEAFDRQWALNIIQLALNRIEESHEDKGKEEVFRAYAIWIPNQGLPNHSEIADSLGISESHSRTLLSRLRKKWIRTLIEEVARTVDSTDLIEDEVRKIYSAVSKPSDLEASKE